MGIKLAMELIKEKPLSEQRLFQAIIVQALEDVMNFSSFKKEAYWKEDAYKCFYANSLDFQDVCWSAEMDPELIRGEFFKLIKLKKIRFSKIQTHCKFMQNNSILRENGQGIRDNGHRKQNQLMLPMVDSCYQFIFYYIDILE